MGRHKGFKMSEEQRKLLSEKAKTRIEKESPKKIQNVPKRKGYTSREFRILNVVQQIESKEFTTKDVEKLLLKLGTKRKRGLIKIGTITTDWIPPRMPTVNEISGILRSNGFAYEKKLVDNKEMAYWKKL